MAKGPIHYDHGVTVYPAKGDGYHRITWYGHDGTRKGTKRAELDDARQVATELVRQLNAGPAADPDRGPDRTFAELAEWYVHPEAHTRPWSPSHEAKTRSILRTWLLPTLGPKPCREITRQDCVAILNRARGRRSPETVRNIGVCLRSIVKIGREAGYFALDHDPMLGVSYTPSSSEQGQSSVWVPLEQRPDSTSVARLAEVISDRYEPWTWLAVMLAGFTGLRWGELFCLHAGDVDLDAGEIRVQRQVTLVEGDVHRHLPKYRKTRTTFIPGFLLEPLRTHIDGAVRRGPATVCPTDCRDRGLEVPRGDGALLFPNTGGGYWRNPGWHDRRFRPACVDAGWPRTAEGKWAWAWHDLRHHFCTWALATPPDGLGLEVADVQHFAGHATPDFTYKAYVSTRTGATGRARSAADGYALPA